MNRQLTSIIWSILASRCYSNNEWNKSSGANGGDIWYSATNFVPVQSKSFGTIKIGRIMSMEFDVIFGGRTNDPHTNRAEMFFRIGYNANRGTNCNAQNSAYPALWLSSNTDTLYISASDGNGCSNLYILNEYGSITPGIPYHLSIAFNDNHFFVEISKDDESDWTKQWDRSPTLESHLGDDVPIWWMSGKFGSSRYNRGNGTFSNVIIKSNWFSYDTPLPTAVLTNQPTSNPTRNPSSFPTVNPTENPTLNPFATLSTSNPTAYPTDDTSKQTQTSVETASLYPSQLPSLPPTMVPVANTTTVFFSSSAASFSKSSSSETYPIIMYIAAATAFIFGLTVMVVLCLCCRYVMIKRKGSLQPPLGTALSNSYRIVHVPDRTDECKYVDQYDEPDEAVSPTLYSPSIQVMSPRSSVREPPLVVHNALAVIICIAEYKDNPQVADLHGIKQDHANLYEFFEYLNFTVIPNKKKAPYWWTEMEVLDLLRNDVGKALYCETHKRLLFDALIVCISCHGLKNAVITSDLRKIEKDVLHRAVSQYHPEVRNIPRIFIIDACDGKCCSTFSNISPKCKISAYYLLKFSNISLVSVHLPLQVQRTDITLKECRYCIRV